MPFVLCNTHRPCSCISLGQGYTPTARVFRITTDFPFTSPPSPFPVPPPRLRPFGRSSIILAFSPVLSHTHHSQGIVSSHITQQSLISSICRQHHNLVLRRSHTCHRWLIFPRRPALRTTPSSIEPGQRSSPLAMISQRLLPGKCDLTGTGKSKGAKTN